MGIVHWDDVEPVVGEAGDIGGAWRRLGRAAGAQGVGLSRIDLPPGKRSTPVHVHADSEEIFFVLRGSGISWQDGKAYRVAAGDCLVHRVREEAHTLIAGDDGMDVLAYGPAPDTNLSWLPRAKVMWVGPHWLPADVQHPYVAELAAGPLEVPEPEPERPPTIVALEEVPLEEDERGEFAWAERDLARAAGSVKTGLRHGVLPPGKMSCPPHWHSAEEELFVVLDGEGTLLLYETDGSVCEEHPLRRGSVVSRPPGSGIAHALRAADAGEMTYLAYGTRIPEDVAYFPRSRKLSFRGLHVRVEPLDYWDGEV